MHDDVEGLMDKLFVKSFLKIQTHKAFELMLGYLIGKFYSHSTNKSLRHHKKLIDYDSNSHIRWKPLK